MRTRSRLNLEISVRVLLLCSTFLCCVRGIFSQGNVTLDSIQIFNRHEPLFLGPKVYFYCEREKKTKLPDVKETNTLYTFKGIESWQPLTELPSDKCKRCGFYEEDTITSDDVFDQWEFCPDDFKAGKYTRFKAKEFNATFICSQCTTGSSHSSMPDDVDGHKGMRVLSVILIIALVLIFSVLGLAALYTHWQKKRKEQEQARFLKLFEDGNDAEDELGLAM